MAYTWEKESLQKYGKEVTARLIKQQKDYEEENSDNDCEKCGRGNQGTVITWEEGKPFIMHYGIWVDGCCSKCGKHQES